MIAFKKMWEDVDSILSKKEIKDIEIVDKFKSGFIVKENGSTVFITRDDFVDFWCRLLYFSELSETQIQNLNEPKFKYVYTIVKNLPYVSEEKGVLRLVQ